MNVAEVTSIAGAGRLMRASEPVEPPGQRQRPDRCFPRCDHTVSDERALRQADRAGVRAKEPVFDPNQLLWSRVEQRDAAREVAGQRAGDHELTRLSREDAVSQDDHLDSTGWRDREREPDFAAVRLSQAEPPGPGLGRGGTPFPAQSGRCDQRK